MARFLVGITCLFALLPTSAVWAEGASPSEYELLQQARSLFREGDYAAAIAVGLRVLESEPSALVRAEAHQYVGASAELLDRTDLAEDHFEELLTLQPTFQIETSEFPTEVLSLFETVRLRMEDRLRVIEEQRSRAEEAERLERERRLRAEQARLARLSRPRYMVQQVRRRYLAVAFLPFGAGQFQNDMPSRGYAFLGSQLALTGASMVLWLLQATMPAEPADRVAARELRDRYQWASYGVYGALVAAVVWGVVDALVNFRGGSGRWFEVDEDDVPEEHRPPLEPERPAIEPPGG